MSSRDGSGSPDSGVDVFNFDIDNAFMGPNDPVMRPEELEEEVNYMFKPHASSRGLSLDFNLDDMENIFDDEVPQTEDISDNTSTSDKYDEQSYVEHATLSSPSPSPLPNQETAVPESPSARIHSYSVKPVRSNKFRAQLRGSRSSKMSARKRKLYELEQPLPDPEAEKCRLNAINAKKNRERKKRQLEEAETEISRLKNENLELRTEAEVARDELEEAREELERMKAMLKLAGLPVDDREE